MCGAPIKVDRAHLADGYAQASVVNSGNANTCAANGVALAEECCELGGGGRDAPGKRVDDHGLADDTGGSGQNVHGVDVDVYKRQPYTLYDEQTASFGEDDDYNQADSAGFINLFGLSIKERAMLSKNWPEVK